jgi:hypothetical protein
MSGKHGGSSDKEYSRKEREALSFHVDRAVNRSNIGDLLIMQVALQL